MERKGYEQKHSTSYREPAAPARGHAQREGKSDLLRLDDDKVQRKVLADALLCSSTL